MPNCKVPETSVIFKCNSIAGNKSVFKNVQYVKFSCGISWKSLKILTEL